MLAFGSFLGWFHRALLLLLLLLLCVCVCVCVCVFFFLCSSTQCCDVILPPGLTLAPHAFRALVSRFSSPRLFMCLCTSRVT